MENRKEQIVNIATSFIKRYGYDSFSYKDLSEAVGITKATLHHHFAKKEDLGLAVCEQIELKFMLIKNKIDQLNTAQQKFEYIMENLPSEITKGEICPISSLQAEYNIIPTSMKEMVTQLSEYENDYLSEILEEGLADGSFHFKGSPKNMSLMIIAAYKGALQYSRSMNDDIINTVRDQIYKQVIKDIN